MKDIVVPYRRSNSDEIRYMLRSLRNVPHGNVYVIGDKTQYNVNHIPYKQTSDIAINTLNIINIAASHSDISDDFIYMHDDQYIMKPIEDIPVHHRGYYKDVVRYYMSRHRHSFYTLRMRRTFERLKKLGIEDPLCYELHIPFVINKSMWNGVSQHITKDLNKLSMYGNLNNIGGTEIKDVKVRSKDIIPTGNFVSTHDNTFLINQAGKMIRDKFNEKSQYE